MDYLNRTAHKLSWQDLNHIQLSPETHEKYCIENNLLLRYSLTTVIQDTNIHTGAHKRDVLLPYTKHKPQAHLSWIPAKNYLLVHGLSIPGTVKHLLRFHFQHKNIRSFPVCIYSCTNSTMWKERIGQKTVGRFLLRWWRTRNLFPDPDQKFHWQNLSETTIWELCSQLMVSNYQGKSLTVNCR